MADPRTWIIELAHSLGFCGARFAPVQHTPHFGHYAAWLEAGHHADMDYLARNTDVRADPRARSKGAKTALVLGMHHHQQRPPDPGGRAALVARYAWGRDYHNLIGKRLKKLQRALREGGIPNWGGVDTAPITERAWAAHAGLGFIGKNSVLFQPGVTSYLLLSVVFLEAELPVDAPLTRDHCGTCTRCLSGCPTDAFVGPRVLDSRRCISYWTIEARGLAPRALRPRFGRWAFGCDVCQEVCPHNHRGLDEADDDFLPRHAWLDCDEILATSDTALMDRFVGTPLRRPKAHGLKRNVAIVLGNLGDPEGVESLQRYGLSHEHPEVRAASVWGLRRLGAVPQLDDDHPLVLAELRAPPPELSTPTTRDS